MIKGLKKSDHLGITVPNLEEALAFFTSLFGAKVVGEADNFKADDDWMKDHLNVHPRAVIKEMLLIELFDGTQLELFEYTSPDQNIERPKNSDLGGYHLAFEVADIEEGIRYLEEQNLKIYSTYHTNATDSSNIKGKLKGVKWIYFESPWGMVFELVEKSKT